MMDEHNDADFASVMWDTPADNKPSSSSSAAAAVQNQPSPLDRRPSSSSYRNNAAPGQQGPGNSSSGNDGLPQPPISANGRYWIKASVSEPVKMLEGTKDAFISYSVTGEVHTNIAHLPLRLPLADCKESGFADKSPAVLVTDLLEQKTLSRLCLLA
jgi:sorting nexin-4